jgi:hypothetical protein
VKPSDFFYGVEDPMWDVNGVDPWRRMVTVFNAELVEKLRVAPQEDVTDLDGAYAMAQLANDELIAYGTGGSNRLDDEDISVVLRSLRAILKRSGVRLDPPFRDFQGFHTYWVAHDMSNSYAARRGYLNELFSPVFSRLQELEDEQAAGAVGGVDGELKNIIFASTGPKPRIVLRDAMNNVVEVTENGQYCLVYDRPLTVAGLTWGELVDWWRAVRQLEDHSDAEVGRALYRRLHASLGSPPELTLFHAYCRRYSLQDGHHQPALLPQVYLHYDPRTSRERGGQPSVLMRERMDFLLLLSHGKRIILEVDGKQHYAEADTASPRLYSEMVAEDRKLRLRGYEVYRFGGHELAEPGAADMLREFFSELLTIHEAAP